MRYYLNVQFRGQRVTTVVVWLHILGLFDGRLSLSE